jgi:hypothetical protein
MYESGWQQDPKYTDDNYEEFKHPKHNLTLRASYAPHEPGKVAFSRMEWGQMEHHPAIPEVPPKVSLTYHDMKFVKDTSVSGRVKPHAMHSKELQSQDLGKLKGFVKKSGQDASILGNQALSGGHAGYGI